MISTEVVKRHITGWPLAGEREVGVLGKRALPPDAAPWRTGPSSRRVWSRSRSGCLDDMRHASKYPASIMEYPLVFDLFEDLIIQLQL